MRLPTPLAIAVLLVLVVAHATADKPKRRHFLAPLLLRGGGISGSARASASGRSDDASTGRGLMHKFMMFKHLFQPPQSNVIIIQPTTTATTTPTTATTTRLARDNGDDHKNDGDNSDQDMAPTGVQDNIDAYALDADVDAHMDADMDEETGSRPVVLHKRRRNSQSDKRPAVVRGHGHNNRRKEHAPSHVLANEGGGGHNVRPSANGRKRKANKRKRKRKIVRLDNQNDGQNSNINANANGNGNGGYNVITMSPQELNNLKKANNNNLDNIVFGAGGGGGGGLGGGAGATIVGGGQGASIFDSNTNSNSNSRLQNFMNAFRRPQTPAVYNL